MEATPSGCEQNHQSPGLSTQMGGWTISFRPLEMLVNFENNNLLRSPIPSTHLSTHVLPD
jgi:hypothetical protein